MAVVHIVIRLCLKSHWKIPSSLAKTTDFVRYKFLSGNQVQYEDYVEKKLILWANYAQDFDDFWTDNLVIN